MSIQIKPALYNIGDLVTEFFDNIKIIFGLISNIEYDEGVQDYSYTILWTSNSAFDEEYVMESLVKWRIENNIWIYYSSLT